MLSSVFPSVYSLFSRRPSSCLKEDVANLNSHDRESLVRDIALGLGSIPVSSNSSGDVGNNAIDLTSSGSSGSGSADPVTDGDGNNFEAPLEDRAASCTATSSLEHSRQDDNSVSALHPVGSSENSSDADVLLNHDIALPNPELDLEGSLDFEAGVDSTLSELRGALTQCISSLETFEEKERFLGVRIRRYRQLMETRKERISCLEESFICSAANGSMKRNDHEEKTSERGDEENPTVTHPRSEKELLCNLKMKHEEDERNLKSVEQIHKDMIGQMESLRRKITSLEFKERDILEKREECQEFLIAAAGCMA